MSDKPDGTRQELLLEEFLIPARRERLEQVLNARSESLTVVLDGVQNYHNISAVIRSADAFGLTEIHLVGESFEFSRGISLGAERWMRIFGHKSAEDALAFLQQRAYEIVVTAPENHPLRAEIPTLPVHDLPFDRRLAVVFGNEKAGVSDAFFQAAAMKAFIPMIGFVESLNISVACAITLYSSMLSGARSERRLQPLPAQFREDLKAEWLMQSVKHSEAILREVESRKR